MEDIIVQIIDFKGANASEFVTINEDGSYTIFIDARASYEAQKEAYEHAMKHINHCDFLKEDVQDIEAHAHDVA